MLPRSWPMQNAKKVVDRNSNDIILKTGYGPSGLPHLGTIAEIIRTRMIQKSLEFQGKEAKIIVFVDNMDGFRKVPLNLPKQDYLSQFLGLPLFKVPDVFGCCENFADHNINELNKLIAQFDLTNHVEVIKSSDMYLSGKFNNALLNVLRNHEKILKIMLPTLGEERQKTYSPFLPISEKSGKVLEVKIEEYKVDEGKITFYDEGELVEAEVINGKCKLQWKVDWGMQWHALGVDYEMYGKDLIDSFSVSKPICKTLGSKAPVNMVYELFLDGDNKKISKSKGNGVSLDDWMNFTPIASMKHFLFLHPERAKKLDIRDLHRYVDAYLKDLQRYHNQIKENDETRYENPIFYTHENDLPPPTELSYAILLNLQKGLRSPNYETFRNFIIKQHGELNSTEEKLVECIYKFAEHHKTESHPAPSWMIKYLQKFIDNMDGFSTGLEMQTNLYALGNEAVENKDIIDLKSWFQTIYLVLFGEETGPRLGPFFELYGKEESMKLISAKIK
ncbi:lysine--tRNA ligase [Candidatus Cytomitobacter primus]|uniref:Lysine--tRNA ligase n=1 Tax=Candidatus Cytomitobacter primus TaxID=2066024 RepID=A0A5C0UHZ2_9PROT|nr:lysine--tRNA ligase [Candidatus Cytomitobacter primus]QEK38564.1 lysine--tRNA ligase [Candidatus Cytomitobacter primus]